MTAWSLPGSHRGKQCEGRERAVSGRARSTPEAREPSDQHRTPPPGGPASAHLHRRRLREILGLRRFLTIAELTRLGDAREAETERGLLLLPEKARRPMGTARWN
jgi:hypothetical protein